MQGCFPTVRTRPTVVFRVLIIPVMNCKKYVYDYIICLLISRHRESKFTVALRISDLTLRLLSEIIPFVLHENWSFKLFSTYFNVLMYCHARCRNTLQLPEYIKKIVTVIDLIPCTMCKYTRKRAGGHYKVSEEGVSQFSKMTEVLFGKRFFIRTQTIGVWYSTIFTASRSSIVDPIRSS